jgi:hypothetical protein
LPPPSRPEHGSRSGPSGTVRDLVAGSSLAFTDRLAVRSSGFLGPGRLLAERPGNSMVCSGVSLAAENLPWASSGPSSSASSRA